MFKHQFPALKKLVSSLSVNDAITRQTLQTVYEETGYLLDPHGAVGYFALAAYLKQHISSKGIVLETAHPVKFPDVVEEITGKAIPIPTAAQHLFSKQKSSIPMDASFDALKEWLINR